MDGEGKGTGNRSTPMDWNREGSRSTVNSLTDRVKSCQLQSVAKEIKLAWIGTKGRLL